MTFLADENFPRPAVQALREAGFDVLWIAQTNPGAADDAGSVRFDQQDTPHV